MCSLKINDLGFRTDLQGLRAIAVLLVVLSHSGFTFISGGFVGVDVFFVLSGFLITRLLVDEINNTDRISFISFYARRIKRLLPALIVMLFISFIVGISILSPIDAQSQLSSSPYAALWLSNMYFAFSHTDYFNELAKYDLFIHTWTLGVEEQFYFLWPIFLLICLKLRNKKCLKELSIKQVLFIGVSLLFFISFSLSLYWSIHAPKLAFYLMPTRIWQFALGGIIYLKLIKIQNIKRQQNNIVHYCMLIVGLAAILISSVLLTANNIYPGFWALIPAIGTALVIISGHRLQHSKNALSHPALVWIGDRSYSLYLWHWPILALGFTLGFNNQVFPLIAMILLSVLMAMLSYRLVELPFWRGRWSKVSSVRIILVSVLVISATILIFNSTLNNILKQDVNKNLTLQWRSDLPIIYRMPCDSWYANSEVKLCLFGDVSASKSIVLLGDSIGAQWFSILPELFPTPEWKISVYTKSSCPIVDEDYFYQRIKKNYQVCTDWRNKVIKELTQTKPDIIIIGSAVNTFFNQEQWVKGSERIFNTLSQVSKYTFVIPGTPSLGFDGPSCVIRNIDQEGRVNLNGCKVEGRLKTTTLVSNYLEQAASSFKNVNVIDLNDLICPDDVCNAINKKGVVVFRDSQHLTDSFVKSQTLEVGKRIRKFQTD